MNLEVQKTKQQVVKEMRKSVKLDVITINLSTIRKKRENTMPEFLISKERNKKYSSNQ